MVCITARELLDFGFDALHCEEDDRVAYPTLHSLDALADLDDGMDDFDFEEDLEDEEDCEEEE